MTEHEAREIANKYLLELVNSDPTYFTSVEVRKVFDENNFEFVFYAAITPDLFGYALGGIAVCKKTGKPWGIGRNYFKQSGTLWQRMSSMFGFWN